MRKIRLYIRYGYYNLLSGVFGGSRLRRARLLAGIAILGSSLSSCSLFESDRTTCYMQKPDSVASNPDSTERVITCYAAVPYEDTIPDSVPVKK